MPCCTASMTVCGNIDLDSSMPDLTCVRQLCQASTMIQVYLFCHYCSASLHRCVLRLERIRRAMASNEEEKHEGREEVEGQSLYADDEGEENNPDPNEFDERPAECTPFGPTPYFELVSDFFEKLQDMRGKRTARGAKGSAEKKRALVQHMFNVCSLRSC